MNRRKLSVLLCTIFSIILTYYVAVLMHEYGHGTTAWIFGYKSSPFEIQYGSWYLVPVSEAVDYAKILAAGHGTQEALVGITGISVTTALFFISLCLLRTQRIQKNIFLLSFFFWLASINLMEMFSYLNRTLVMGDIYEFIQGLHISPLWIFIPNAMLVSFGLYQFYRYEIPKMFRLLPIETYLMRRVFLWITFWPLLFTVVYGGSAEMWPVFSHVLNIISACLILFILFACDPAQPLKKTCDK